jgi:ketosteroid isomerase-like protein
MAISFALPIAAQQKDSVDPEVRQQIEAVLIKFDEEYNKHDAAAIADLFTPDAVTWIDGPREAVTLPASKQSRKGTKPWQANHLVAT